MDKDPENGEEFGCTIPSCQHRRGEQEATKDVVEQHSAEKESVLRCACWDSSAAGSEDCDEFLPRRWRTWKIPCLNDDSPTLLYCRRQRRIPCSTDAVQQELPIESTENDSQCSLSVRDVGTRYVCVPYSTYGASTSLGARIRPTKKIRCGPTVATKVLGTYEYS